MKYKRRYNESLATNGFCVFMCKFSFTGASIASFLPEFEKMFETAFGLGRWLKNTSRLIWQPVTNNLPNFDTIWIELNPTGCLKEFDFFNL